MAFCSVMDRADQKRERWGAVGTFAFWVLVYFWSVWLFKELLADVPERPLGEAYWQQQILTRGGGGPGASSPGAQEAAEARRGF